MANKDKLLADAQKFLSKGQVSKAIGEYQKLVAAFPKDARNRQKLAELLSRDKRNLEALTEYEAVAKHYTDTGFYLKAIAVFKQMQKLDASRVDLYLRLAELNEKQGLVGNALSEYRTLVAYYDKNAMHLEAVGILEKMSALDPGNLNYEAKIAECYKDAGKNAEAFEAFESIISRLADQQEHTKIIKLYDRFLSICPEGAAARLPLGRALLKSGANEKAVQVFKSLLKQAPDDPEVIRSLTDAHIATGDYSNARITLKHLLKLVHDDLDLREDYLRICLDGGETEQARDRLEEWKDAFFQAGRVKQLLGFYQELKTARPDDELIDESLALIYEAAGMEGQEKFADSGKTTQSSTVTADDAFLEDAISDVETLEMVGEEIDPEVEVPPLEIVPPQKTKAAVATLDLDFDLDLDLDLDLGQDKKQDEIAAEPVIEESPEVEGAEAGAQTDGPGTIDDEAEADEVEMEFDLESLTGLDLEFEIETDEKLVVEEEVAEEEIVEEEIVEEEIVEEVIEEEIADDEVFGEQASAELEELEVLDEIEELEELEELEEVDEVEVLEDLEVLEEAVDEEDTGIFAGKVARAVSAASQSIEAEMEEAEFYLQQGLYEDAARIVQSLLESNPDLPALHAKMAEIQERQAAESAEPESGAFVDLMADLHDDELLEATDFLNVLGDNAPSDDVFTQELATEIDSADTESHFNLGIAYKEMGLFEDAIAEFDKASADPGRRIDCLTLTGQCHLEAGETEAALKAFKSGLSQENLNEAGRKTLNFELGLLYQSTGQLLEALESFQLVAEQDSFFRDVGDRIKALRKQLGLDEDSGDDGPQGNRDRVSYV